MSMTFQTALCQARGLAYKQTAELNTYTFEALRMSITVMCGVRYLSVGEHERVIRTVSGVRFCGEIVCHA